MASNPAESNVAVKALDFDPHGDVVFVLREGKMRFRINSHILSFLSSVFKVLLGTESRFKEATELAARGANSPPLDIPLGDDDPEALEIVLWAIHHRGDMVPSTVNVSLLHRIAVVCDKYCIPKNPLQVWLEKWIPSETLNMDDLDYEWLFISYIFEEKAIFKAVSKSIILNCIQNRRGECARRVTRFSVGWRQTTTSKEIDSFVPKRILDSIMVARKGAIDLMLSAVDKLVDLYQNDSQSQCRYLPAPANARDSCNAINLGFIIRKLTAEDLYPKTDRHLDQTLLKDLKTRLVGLSVSYFYLEVMKACCDKPNRNRDSATRRDKCTHCHGTYRKLQIIDHKDTCDPFITFRKQICTIYNYVWGLNPDHFWKKES